MARDFDVGATLELRGLTQWRAQTRAAAEDVDNIGEKAQRTSTSLSVMGRIGRGAGRAILTGLRRAAIGTVAAIGAIGAISIHAGIEAQSAQSQIVAGIRSTGAAANVTVRQVDNLSTRIMRYSGISDELVKQGAGVLLTFTNIRNEMGRGNGVFDQAITASADLATRFKTDLPNAAKQLGKALQDPIRGVTALRRVGVDFNQQQQDQIKTLVESGRVLDAQKLILAEIRKEVGGSARAAGRTPVGQWNVFRETVQNSLERVGNAILPVATSVLPQLAKALSQLFVGLAPVLKQVAGSLARILPGIIKSLLPALRMLGGLFAQLVRLAGPIIKVLAVTFVRFLRALLPALKPFLEALARALLPLLKALAPILVTLAKPLADMLIALTPLIEPIAKVITLLLQLAGPVITAVNRAVAWLTEHVLRPLVTVLTAVVRAVQKVIEWFQKLPGMAVTAGPVDVPRGFQPFGIKGPVHRAAGGPVMALRPYLVGERGIPEIFVPPVNGTVVPIERFTMPKVEGGDGTQMTPVQHIDTINVDARGLTEDEAVRAVSKGVSDALARR